MNFKAIIAIGLGVATLGLSLPAFADSATIITNEQEAVVTGNGNRTNQRINNRVNNNERRNRDAQATDISNRQGLDLAGNRNRTNQNTNNVVNNTRNRNR
jgi:hypothetical protein